MTDFAQSARDATEAMREVFPPTPLLRNAHLSEQYDAEVYLKDARSPFVVGAVAEMWLCTGSVVRVAHTRRSRLLNQIQDSSVFLYFMGKPRINCAPQPFARSLLMSPLMGNDL